MGHGKWVGLVEDKSVEHTVDEVTRCSSKNHREYAYVYCPCSPSYYLGYVPRYQADGNETEETEKDLWHDGHSERHAFVFDEDELKPVCDVYAFVQRHTGLHLNLYDLVNDQYRQGDDDGDYCLGLFCH